MFYTIYKTTNIIKVEKFQSLDYYRDGRCTLSLVRTSRGRADTSIKTRQQFMWSRNLYE